MFSITKVFKEFFLKKVDLKSIYSKLLTNKIKYMTTNISFFKLSNKSILAFAVASIAFVIMSVPFLANAAPLTRELQKGMSGADVSDLQRFLAQDSTIYPQGLITGYFGPLTFSAVSNFQSRNGIATVGRVGPITLAAINAQMSGGVSTGIDVYAPYISGVDVSKSGLTANVSWNTSEPARGVVYYSTNFLTTYENLHTVDVSGSTAMTDNNLRSSQNVQLSGLQSNSVYYYLIYSTDASGNVSITLPTTFRSN